MNSTCPTRRVWRRSTPVRLFSVAEDVTDDLAHLILELFNLGYGVSHGARAWSTGDTGPFFPSAFTSGDAALLRASPPSSCRPGWARLTQRRGSGAHAGAAQRVQYAFDRRFQSPRRGARRVVGAVPGLTWVIHSDHQQAGPTGGNHTMRRMAMPSRNGCEIRRTWYLWDCRTRFRVGVSSVGGSLRSCK
jgi:hypothetical protein